MYAISLSDDALHKPGVYLTFSQTRDYLLIFVRMHTEALIAAIQQITPIEPEAIEAMLDILSPREVRKGEVIWNAGETSRHILFINSGALRYYYSKGGKEINGQFFFENEFFTDYYSFITREPMGFTTEALEDSSLLLMPRSGIFDLYERFKSFERLGRLIAEQNFISLHNTRVDLHTKTPEELYLDLLSKRPMVLQRVPLYMIASYMGITAEHLSRIRKKVLTS
jgi:CRP-like cAMP-binding protein